MNDNMDDTHAMPLDTTQWPSASSARVELNRYARERDALLGRIVQELERDARVCAAWLSGSFGRGVEDEWSDLDLHVAVEDADFDRVLAEREELYRRVGTPILIQPELPSDSVPGGLFQLVLYTGPIEVDWNIGPVGQAVRPVAHRLLFARSDIPVVRPRSLSPAERRQFIENRLTFFWAMAPIAVKHCGRGDTRAAVAQIGLLTAALIALQRLIAEPGGPDPLLHGTNRPIEPEIDVSLPRTGPTITPLNALQVIEELCAQMEQLHAAVAALGVAVPSTVPAEVEQMSALAAAIAREGNYVQRPYR